MKKKKVSTGIIKNLLTDLKYVYKNNEKSNFEYNVHRSTCEWGFLL